MRIFRFLLAAGLCLCLAGCVSSLLVGNQFQNQLMGAVLKPLVGFDPNDVDLFEIPLVKSRMTALLGDQYEPAMALLTTAQSIQREGALYYVASRYAPDNLREYTDQAAMIWNADTDQMAILLIQDGAPALIAEPLQNAAAALTPQLPGEVQQRLDQALALKHNVEQARETLAQTRDSVQSSLVKGVENASQNAIQRAADSAQTALPESTQQALEAVQNTAGTVREVDATLKTTGQPLHLPDAKSAQ